MKNIHGWVLLLVKLKPASIMYVFYVHTFTQAVFTVQDALLWSPKNIRLRFCIIGFFRYFYIMESNFWFMMSYDNDF